MKKRMKKKLKQLNLKKGIHFMEQQNNKKQSINRIKRES